MLNKHFTTPIIELTGKCKGTIKRSCWNNMVVIFSRFEGLWILIYFTNILSILECKTNKILAKLLKIIKNSNSDAYLGKNCNWFLTVPCIILTKFTFQLNKKLKNLLPCWEGKRKNKQTKTNREVSPQRNIQFKIHLKNENRILKTKF